MDAARAALVEVIAFIEAALADGADAVELDALDPDVGRGLYAGESVVVEPNALIHRPFRVWLDLAERLGLRLCTPRPVPPTHIRLRFERLAGPSILRGTAPAADDHDHGHDHDHAAAAPAAPAALATHREKYGTASEFARIDKREDARFVLDLREALTRIGPISSVLAIGCNTGDELELVRNTLDAGPAAVRMQSPGVTPTVMIDAPGGTPGSTSTGASRVTRIVGVDHSASAIAAARARFAGDPRITLREADARNLAPLALGRFDLVLSIGTLQSGALDDRALLRTLVQDHLAPDGAVILGVPNCRYRDGELEYGARIKNLSEPELGLLVKDAAFYRKYLQQHHMQVFVTGKHYIFVTAVALSR